MMYRHLALAGLAVALAAVPSSAQVGVPAVRDALGSTTGAVRGVLNPALDDLAQLPDRAQDLARQRIERIDRLVRRQREAIELDPQGQPARKGVLLVMDPAPDLAQRLAGTGFRVAATESLGELGLSVAQVEVPEGLSLDTARKRLVQQVPGAQVTADNILFPQGTTLSGQNATSGSARTPFVAAPVGVIDSGAAGTVEEQKGFARGAPFPANHGSAIVSLLRGAGVRRVLVADVYGTDPAGGNALAIARAFDWLVGRKVRVIGISLVGPPNPVLQRAVAGAQKQGVTIIAPVGNDGPAAPPAYPASFNGVLAVTGVDARNRVLIEAGRALHLDYAAPGADILASDAKGQRRRVRGTSFAVPLVAARAAAAQGSVVSALDREAVDLGPKGPDSRYGRGLICAVCRTP